MAEMEPDVPDFFIAELDALADPDFKASPTLTSEGDENPAPTRKPARKRTTTARPTKSQSANRDGSILLLDCALTGILTVLAKVKGEAFLAGLEHTTDVAKALDELGREDKTINKLLESSGKYGALVMSLANMGIAIYTAMPKKATQPATAEIAPLPTNPVSEQPQITDESQLKGILNLYAND